KERAESLWRTNIAFMPNDGNILEWTAVGTTAGENVDIGAWPRQCPCYCASKKTGGSCNAYALAGHVRGRSHYCSQATGPANFRARGGDGDHRVTKPAPWPRSAAKTKVNIKRRRLSRPKRNIAEA